MAAAVPPITIYALNGSQFVAKVLVALDARQIPHAVEFVDPIPSKRKLPSGGLLVPEMVYNKDVIVQDSDVILQHMDKHHGTDFFPASKPEVTEVCSRASSQLAAFIHYYNWAQEDTYRKTMAYRFQSLLPSVVCCFRKQATDYLLKDARQKFTVKAATVLGLDPDNMPTEAEMLKRLIAELVYYQDLLKTEEQVYLVEGTSQLTAADAAVYAQVERIVGTSGDANIPAAIPSLLEEPKLARFWRWHTQMREKHPIIFKGKRAEANGASTAHEKGE